VSWPGGRASARAGALGAVASLLLAAAGPAQAELRFKRCKGSLAPCARLSVPLDRTGATPGRVRLFVQRTRALRGPSRGVVFALAGGPGQSASFSFEGDALGAIGPAFRRRDLIVFDQRGTGRSGALNCRELQRSNLFDAGGEAGRCARQLGARRFHYTSRASVEDIEAIRRELGVARITLYGTSYGVKVALGYALTYPGNVERLVLDSVVETDGPDSFYLDALAALPRVLLSLCRSGCSSFTADPVADLSRLVARVGAGRLRGAVIDARGRRRATTLTSGELWLILLAGDFDPALRAATPGAVRAALDGDPVPLLRLKRRSIAVDARPPPSVLLSTGLFAATTCEEETFPWARGTPPDPFERRRHAQAAAAALPAGSFGPFDAGAILESDLLQLCDRWPAAPLAPGFGAGPLPDVPTLILEGEDDLRTPVENAQRVAALFPQSRLVVSPATGHSALSSDLSGCAARAFARFFADRPVADCPPRRRRFVATPPPPRALAAVAPARGSAGVRGRVLGALGLALRDVAADSLTQFIVRGRSDLARGGGLRAGSYRIAQNNTLRLRGVAYVPGLRVSGVVERFGERRQAGRLSVSGPAAPGGTLRLRGRRIGGRLGGRRVSATLGGGVFRARAAAARLPGPRPGRAGR
jgi:pimeloyl-ACP methyl ester carboxylesterase